MALVKTVASSAPMVARPKAISTTGTRSVRPGAASHKPHSPTTSSTEKKAIHGLRVWLGIGDGAEHRRERRGDQLGDAGGVGPQRRAARRIGHEAVDEIGREQEGDDERVEGLRRPVEQHPADQRALARRLATLARFARPATGARRHRARSDGWAARSGRPRPGGKCLARILPQRSMARMKPSVACRARDDW